MALVRGVICLSLSDWAPAVAPSLAPLHSPRPATPHLSQMGVGKDRARRRRGGEEERRRRRVTNKQSCVRCVTPSHRRRTASWRKNRLCKPHIVLIQWTRTAERQQAKLKLLYDSSKQVKAGCSRHKRLMIVFLFLHCNPITKRHRDAWSCPPPPPMIHSLSR